MKKRFSDHELYILRNKIPIDVLIQNALPISSRIIGGYFRFICPFCSEFNTAINLKTNLARCFLCEKNMNAIDLVMITKKLDFVKSVNFLKNFHKTQRCNEITKSNSTSSSKSNISQANEESRIIAPNDLPLHISEVFRNMMSPQNNVCESYKYPKGRISQKESAANNQNAILSICQSLNDRILKLEEKMNYLICKIDKLTI